MNSTGRTAIVTGGGKRVGEAIVRALLQDGWTVVAHVHHQDDAVPEGSVKVVAELANADCAKRIFAAAKGRPPVRLLVNNAARFALDSLGSANAEEFDSHLAINARAPMLLIDELARTKGEGDALVVNMLDAKLAAPNPDFLSYTISKFALAGLGEVAARALAGKGIRVNAIAPALMLPSGEQDQANFAAVHSFTPLNRGIDVADVIAALRYLVDSTAITGQTLVLDGGQRFMALPRDVQFLSPSGNGQFLER
ncbi:MAG TPA: SDR family oxidoreductase [Sphingomicrobium sp.]|nr:SDR family oxidoreductase [Sphingomicrobium sp.]